MFRLVNKKVKKDQLKLVRLVFIILCIKMDVWNTEKENFYKIGTNIY